MADLILKKVKTNNIEDVGKKIAEIYERCGWSRVQLVMLRPKTGEFLIRIHNNALARGERSKTTSCYYLKGLLEGLAERLAESPAKAEETKCMSRGDPYCEFFLVLNNKRHNEVTLF